MLKRILLVFLCFILALSAVSCNSGFEVNDTTPATDTQTITEESASDTQTQPSTETETETQITVETLPTTQPPIATETLPATQAPISTETQPSTQAPVTTESQTETTLPTEEITTESETVSDLPAPIKLSGENRYKTVYASSVSQSVAKKITTKLKTLDKNATSTSYYELTTDETASDGSPEILVGLTNRIESQAAKETLSGYLDFTVAVLGEKIIIYANTEDRIEDAIQYFFMSLKKTEDGVYFAPTTLLYTDTYEDYPLSDFTISKTEIKNFSIVVPSKATADELNTANELQAWIGENTGANLSIKKDSASETTNEIIIGSADRTEASKYTEAYKETIYYAIETKGTKLLIVAGASGTYSAALSAFKEKATELKGKINSISDIKLESPLNNKKTIFIGNSFIFWGNCVNYMNYTTVTDMADLQARLKGDDNGYFKQVCKANGSNMTVYNFTYGGKNLEWVYTNKLSKIDPAFFTDIDYVFISEAGENNSSFKNTVKKIAALFPNATEIAYLAHEYTFRTNANHIINALPSLANEGIKIVPWGKLVYDVHTGKVSVPGAKLTYNKNSFIKNSTGALPSDSAVMSLSGNGDNFHQNPLSGYITAQMCFSAVSGTSAQGQKYDFCWDKTLGAQYDFDNFLRCHYNNGETSNFVKIFNSAPDMLGLQKLIDDYIEQYN